ncbi:MAG TPA: FAD-binding oxidoreductase [Methylomirabilota bacterium]|nr:FAD-binding oxidoreductase [Methylomirabilota bacterium]
MSGRSADTAAALAAVVGPRHVLAGEAAAGVLVDGVAPRWIASPATVDEVAGCLTLAASRGLAVVPAGGGARLSWGSVPTRVDLLLSLARLDRVLAWEPDDLTVSVQAGVRLTVLDAHIRDRRQMLALDPPRPDATTVGGAIATGVAGPGRARYGTMRELLLGVTVVQGNGTVVRGGGRVVKNVTGYDIPKLHVGALGTLGVVVEAHLRLHPVPAAEGTWVFAFPGPEAALEAARALRDTPVVPSRLQLVSRSRPSAPGAGSVALAVGLGSVPEAVDAQGERVSRLCRGMDGEGGRIDDGVHWWAATRAMTLPPTADTLVLRIGSRPGDVAKAWRVVEAVATRAELDPVLSAEVPHGVLHAALTGSGVREAPAVVARVRADLAPLEASCVVEHAPIGVKADLDVWGDPGPALPFMRRLKAELDPGAILNPGRFVGRI